MGVIYELRRQGVTLCHSTIQNLGYPPQLLRDMARHGIYLYINGKKSRPGADTPKAAGKK